MYEIVAPGRVPVVVHWQTRPRLVILRALVSESQMEIELTPEQARSLANMLIDGAGLAERS